MLADLLATAHNLAHKATDTVQDSDIFQKIFHKESDAMVNGLNAGDSAQFAAGLLYAYSGQTVDARDYLVSCSMQNPGLDDKLVSAFDYYNDKNITSGNKNMRDTEPYYRRSMIMCDETNQYFEDMSSAAQDFMS